MILDPNKVSSQGGTIAQEVIAHLEAQYGSDVTIDLEIQATRKDPAPGASRGA